MMKPRDYKSHTSHKVICWIVLIYNSKHSLYMESYSHLDNCKKKHCTHCQKCDPKYEFNSLLYCKKCFTRISHNIPKTTIYVNKKIDQIVDKLTDLFCLDHRPIIVLHDGEQSHGYCAWHTTPIVIHLYMNKGRLKVSMIVHEMIHAMGYNHEWEINGWANFRSDPRLDNFTPLIMKDLFGKKEIIL